MQIRDFHEDDWPGVWPIVREVVRAGDTYAYEPDMTAEQAHNVWVERPPARTVVAVDGAQVLGTARMGPNREGPGDHVSTASYMVSTAARGRGVGKALFLHSLRWARERGYAGMQFNAVVETNHAAVELYKRYGFAIVGTVPGAFRHPSQGRVGLYVMYHEFDRT